MLALAGLVGEGTTCHALEHRMRPIKKLADEFATQLKTKNETPVGKSSAKGGEYPRSSCTTLSGFISRRSRLPLHQTSLHISQFPSFFDTSGV